MRSRAKSQLIYISGPITGMLQSTIRFKETEKWLRNDGHKVLNPMEIENPRPNTETEEDTWVYYMKEALAMLLTADCIYMMEDCKIVEFGTYDELIANKGPFYKMT